MDTKNFKRLKIKPEQIVFISIITLLVIWLFVSNNVMLLSQETVLKKINDMPEDKSVVYKSVGDYQTRDDLFEYVTIAGWAFCETDKENPDRYVNILLKQADGDSKYEVISRIGTRDDIQHSFPELHIKGYQLDFFAHFSTINLPNGLYQIYLYCWENEDDHGAVNTGQMIEKKGRNTSIIIDNPVITPTVKQWVFSDTGAEVHTSIDSVEILEHRALFISGWAFCDTTENNNEKSIQIIFHSDSQDYAFASKPEERIDVYNAFKDSASIQGFNHGYHCTCDLSSLPAGDYELFLCCNESEHVRGLTPLGKTVHHSSEGMIEVEDTI